MYPPGQLLQSERWQPLSSCRIFAPSPLVLPPITKSVLANSATPGLAVGTRPSVTVAATAKIVVAADCSLRFMCSPELVGVCYRHTVVYQMINGSVRQPPKHHSLATVSRPAGLMAPNPSARYVFAVISCAGAV